MNNENTISLIETLTSTPKFSIFKLEEILNCKFQKVENEENDLIWLLEENPLTPEVYISNKSNIYPQIKNLRFENLFIDTDKKEYFLSISLKSNNFIQLDSITNVFGKDYKLITQAANVPDDKRCYIEYIVTNKLLTLGFQTCNNLNQISNINIRFN